VSVELAPLATICGFALIVTVGGGDGGATVTVTDCGTLPPAPVQVSENVLVLVKGPVDCDPPDALAPVHAPEAVQPVALIDDQVSVEDAPIATDAGLAASDTVGADEVWSSPTGPTSELPQAVAASATTTVTIKHLAR
jgi:hypothetical protein